MNFLKSTVMGLGSAFSVGSVGGLPYILDTEPQEDKNQLTEFVLLRGKSKQDGHSVTIFKSKQIASPLTQNSLRRIRTLRHPNVLAFIVSSFVRIFE